VGPASASTIVVAAIAWPRAFACIRSLEKMLQGDASAVEWRLRGMHGVLGVGATARA
jgi:hypothetical protein